MCDFGQIAKMAKKPKLNFFTLFLCKTGRKTRNLSIRTKSEGQNRDFDILTFFDIFKKIEIFQKNRKKKFSNFFPKVTKNDQKDEKSRKKSKFGHFGVIWPHFGPKMSQNFTTL